MIYLAMFLVFDAKDYPEDQSNLVARATFRVSHNTTFAYNFRVMVSQRILYPVPVVWPFEINQTDVVPDTFELSTTIRDNASCNAILEDDLLWVHFCLRFPLQKGFVTEVWFDGLTVDVIKQETLGDN